MITINKKDTDTVWTFIYTNINIKIHSQIDDEVFIRIRRELTDLVWRSISWQISDLICDNIYYNNKT